jgi:arylsulfatase
MASSRDAAQSIAAAIRGNLSNSNIMLAQQYFDRFKFQFWRFVFVQQVVGNELQTFLNFPPMQKGASSNLDAVKAEMEKRMSEAAAVAKGPGQ